MDLHPTPAAAGTRSARPRDWLNQEGPSHALATPSAPETPAGKDEVSASPADVLDKYDISTLHCTD
jgi:hypothetical protein